MDDKVEEDAVTNNVLKPATLLFLGSLFIVSSAAAVDVTTLQRTPDVLDRVAGQVLGADNPALLRAFGLGPGEGLATIRSTTRSNGNSVTRYRQTWRGVPVWGRQLIVERAADGGVHELRGRLIQGIGQDVRSPDPAFARDAAVDAVKNVVVDSYAGQPVEIAREKAELVVFVSDNNLASLAYAVELLADRVGGGAPSRPIHLIDANSGATLLSYDALAHQSAPCTDPCTLLDETGLAGSQQTRGKNAAPADFLQFSFTTPGVPLNSDLTVSLSGGSGDADLYVRKGSPPTTSSYDCRPYQNGNNEVCNLKAGSYETWYVGVYAYGSFSDVSLRATIKAPVLLQIIGNGPGGNEKTGVYYYGPEGSGADFGALDLTIANNTCTMSNVKVKTVDLNNGTSGSSAYSYADDGSCYQAADPANGAYSPLNDAHYFGGVVFDMFESYLGVAPLSFQLTMRVHYGVDYENAFWDGSQMTFGDGKSYFYPLVSLDISAHEVSHGFTEQNSNLIYSDQSGGMNEAFSDIAGEAAEYFMRGAADFLVGAEIFKAAGALRYMNEPTLDGTSIDHVSDYYKGMDVHYSSGVFNKAFYELAATQGYGVEKAFKAFAWANQNCWVADSTFQEGAQCVLAEVLAQDDDLGYPPAAVVAAFEVVGISLTLPEPPSAPALQAIEVVSFERIDLAWSDVTNESGYVIERAANGGAYASLASVGAGVTSYSDTGLTPLTSYDYRVSAFNDYGSSAMSNTLSGATPEQPPAAPITLQIDEVGKSKGYNYVLLSWSPAGAGDQLSVDGAEFADVPSGTYLDETGLKGGMTRTYQICNAGACSDIVTVIW